MVNAVSWDNSTFFLERACPALKHMHTTDTSTQAQTQAQTQAIKTKRHFSLSDFDFHLPPELIAQHPAPERSLSKLLDGSQAQAVDRIFKSLPDLMAPGDLLVFNDTQVVKARVFGEKATGGKVELLIERVLTGHQVVAHMKVSKKPPVGAVLRMGIDAHANGAGFEATLIGAAKTDYP